MADLTLQAQLRTITGKKVRQLRRQGLVPANIYGRGVESTPIQLDLRHLRQALLTAGTSTVIDVHVTTADGSEDGKTHPVLIEKVSRHPGTGQVLHVDLHQVDLNRPVHTAVPLVLAGESPAVKLGGVLMHAVDSLEVEALPRALPHSIEVDISGLAELDTQITAGEVSLPPGVKLISDPETVIAHVVASKLEQEVAAEAAEAAAEAAAEEAPAAEAAETEAPTAGEAAEQS